jgi:hypothetical protein
MPMRMFSTPPSLTLRPSSWGDLKSLAAPEPCSPSPPTTPCRLHS